METSLLALVGFAVAATITPGPNNVMVAASAARHGVRATVPHMLGIALGFTLMIMLVGIGLAGVVTQLPALAVAMRWGALLWVVVLAWRIAHAELPGHETGPKRPPMGLVGGMLFQWVNPKAWLLALSANAAFTLQDRALLPQTIWISLVFLAVSLPCVLPWAMLGSAAARVLGSPGKLRWFNRVMAGLLVASMLPVAFGI